MKQLPPSRRNGLWATGRFLIFAFLGGILALLLTGAVLFVAGYPVYEEQPSGYVNPSAAVGGAIQTVIYVVIIFLAGGFGLAIVDLLWTRLRRKR